jgi:hypothetical protein
VHEKTYFNKRNQNKQGRKPPTPFAGLVNCVHEKSDEVSLRHATHIHANQQSQRRNGWWRAGKSVQRFSGFWQRKVPDKYCAFFGFSIWAHTNFSLLADGPCFH